MPLSTLFEALQGVPARLRRRQDDATDTVSSQAHAQPTPEVDAVVAAADERLSEALREQVAAIEALLDDHDASLPPLRELAPELTGHFDEVELTDMS